MSKKPAVQKIVLIRAIGPATHKKMSMQQLRASCIEAGFKDARTYIATGNILFSSSASSARIQKIIQSVLKGYGLDNDVIIRNLDEVRSLLGSSPLPQAAKERPNHLLTVFFNQKVSAKSAEELISRNFVEEIVVLEREICIDYVEGVARSKLTPSLIDRVIGQPGTARNWNTVGKLVALLEK